MQPFEPHKSKGSFLTPNLVKGHYFLNRLSVPFSFSSLSVISVCIHYFSCAISSVSFLQSFSFSVLSSSSDWVISNDLPLSSLILSSRLVLLLMLSIEFFISFSNFSTQGFLFFKKLFLFFELLFVFYLLNF